MTLIDNYNTIYKAVKKNGQYYLIQEHFDRYKKTKFDRVILKGIENINTYCKNNHLKRVEEMFRDLYEN